MVGAGGQCSCDMALPNPFHYIIQVVGLGVGTRLYGGPGGAT
jgi:hypothetical protein